VPVVVRCIATPPPPTSPPPHPLPPDYPPVASPHLYLPRHLSALRTRTPHHAHLVTAVVNTAPSGHGLTMGSHLLTGRTHRCRAPLTLHTAAQTLHYCHTHTHTTRPCHAPQTDAAARDAAHGTSCCFISAARALRIPSSSLLPSHYRVARLHSCERQHSGASLLRANDALYHAAAFLLAFLAFHAYHLHYLHLTTIGSSPWAAIAMRARTTADAWRAWRSLIARIFSSRATTLPLI